MVKRFVIPFAATGDKSVTPDATDPAGAISYSQGWGASYQLPESDPNYRPVGRQEMNGVLNDITGAIAEIQTLGFPAWVPVTGLVTPYAINAYVRYNDIVYKSIVANNSAVPGTDITKWVELRQDGRFLAERVFTANTTYTPTPGTAFIVVEAVGGGGAGGGIPVLAAGSVSGGGGGASGAYGKVRINSGFAGAAISVGAAGTGVIGGAGGAGTSSSFGAVLTCPGGAGAALASSSTGVGITGTPGTASSVPTGASVGFRGGPGTVGFSVSSTSGTSGLGASSRFGSGGGGGVVNGVNQAAAGNAGGGYGSGGGGALGSGGTGVGQAGGNGAPGLVIVTEYTL